MPHLVILYTPNLEPLTDLSALCRSLAAAMQTVRDEAGAVVFPTGGIRVLAYPAAHFAVADNKPPAKPSPRRRAPTLPPCWPATTWA
jgi:5-carboxymethyl-2-hydroxymuconate isomerase